MTRENLIRNAKRSILGESTKVISMLKVPLEQKRAQAAAASKRSIRKVDIINFDWEVTKVSTTLELVKSKGKR